VETDSSIDAPFAVDGPAADARLDAPSGACGAPGSLDLGFSTNGLLSPVFGFGGLAAAGAVVIEPSTSRILIGGNALHDGYSAFAVVRLLPSGARDPSFGNGGVALLGIPGADCFINDIALQPDGTLVGVGGVNDLARARFGMIRLDPDGNPDTTFGVGGIVVTDPAGLTQGMGVAIDAKTRIVAAVAAWDGFEVLAESRFTTLRFLSTGAADLTFGTGGIAEPAFDNGQDVAYDVMVQADGRILVAGAVASLDSTTVPKFGIVRYLDDGRRDATYGTAGLTTVDVLDAAAAYGATIDASGQALLVGEATANTGAISRLTPLGARDLTFGQAGIATTPMHPGFENVTVAGSGDIIAVGAHGVVRFLASGAVDQAFGVNGLVTQGSIHDLEHDVAVQSDGRIVVVGTRVMGTPAAPTMDWFAARYCP
jgi:uncharacterized delta-60 repeat protein